MNEIANGFFHYYSMEMGLSTNGSAFVVKF